MSLGTKTLGSLVLGGALGVGAFIGTVEQTQEVSSSAAFVSCLTGEIEQTQEIASAFAFVSHLDGAVEQTQEINCVYVSVDAYEGITEQNQEIAAQFATTLSFRGTVEQTQGVDAWVGEIIDAKWATGGPGFRLNDIIRAQRIDPDLYGNKVLVYNIIAEVVGLERDGRAILRILDGKEYLDAYGRGAEFIRIDNSVDPERRGLVGVFTSSAGAPYIAVIRGTGDYKKFGALETFRTILGRLDWFNDPEFGQLQGDGLYGNNVYLKGKMVLAAGSSIQWADVTGAGKPEDNATVGADWSANLANIPIRFKDAPEGSGLFITATHMGYYSAGAWKTYMDNAGNFSLGNYAAGDIGLQWNQGAGELSIRGTIHATSGIFTGTIYATDGTISVSSALTQTLLVRGGNQAEFGDNSEAQIRGRLRLLGGVAGSYTEIQGNPSALGNILTVPIASGVIALEGHIHSSFNYDGPVTSITVVNGIVTAIIP